MTDTPAPDPGQTRIERDARAERLARALRDNLHRRKEQARAPAKPPPPSPLHPTPSTPERRSRRLEPRPVSPVKATGTIEDGSRPSPDSGRSAPPGAETMDRILIRGGVPLSGTIPIGGAKNAALPLMAASLLDRRAAGPRQPAGSRRHHDDGQSAGAARRRDRTACPTTRAGATRPGARIVGARTSPRRPRPTIWCARCAPRCWCWGRWSRAAAAAACRCRAAARSARGRSICTSRGCSGSAPRSSCSEGYIEARAPKGLRGAEIVFPSVSVGATENLLMAATLAEGETRADQRRARARDHRPGALPRSRWARRSTGSAATG